MSQHPRKTAKTSYKGASTPQGDGTASEKRLPAGTEVDERPAEINGPFWPIETKSGADRKCPRQIENVKEVLLNLFELVRSRITVKQAAEKYGLPINRSGMTRCPFHDDHAPSMKLNDNFYYCFGCQATGDVINLTAQLFGLSKYNATKKLAADFGLSPDTPPVAVAFPASMRTKSAADTGEWIHCQHVLLDYLELLDTWRTNLAPATPEEPQDERFVEALHGECYVEYLLECLDNRDSRAEVAEKMLKDGLIFELEMTVKRAREGAGNEQQSAA